MLFSLADYIRLTLSLQEYWKEYGIINIINPLAHGTSSSLMISVFSVLGFSLTDIC